MKTIFLLLLSIVLIINTESLNAQYLAQANKSYRASTTTLVKVFPDDPAKKSKKRKMMSSPGYGALTGFAIGAIGGVALGLTGKDWVLKSGKVVSRPVHAIVDAFIVGTPLAVMGSVWGARRDRSTLEPSKWHAAIAGGWSGVMTYRSMLNAATISGLPRHIPHWFGYLHYPNGQNSSTPYTWNISVDYNFTKKFSTGFSFNNFVKQTIVEGAEHNDTWHDFEYAMGESYSLLADYTFNPITPENKTRLVFAVGAGASVHRLLAGGVLGTVDYRVQKYTFTPHYRFTIDYMSRKNLSLQLKAGYKPLQNILIPEQTSGGNTLVAHSINYRALDVTVGVRYHFNALPF